MPDMIDLKADKPREECGVCGVFGTPEAAKLVYLGLYALQHRGQESAGIVASDHGQVTSHRAQGLVADVFKKDVLDSLPGDLAVGHVRYSTTGANQLRNAGPFIGRFADGGWLAVSHNGNLVNSSAARSTLEKQGVVFESSSDTEVIMHSIRVSDVKAGSASLADQVIEGLKPLQGAFSLVIMNQHTLVAARDPRGFRPLCLGRLKRDGYAVASETCAFDLIEAEYIRDIEPGEVLVIDAGGVRSLRPFASESHAMCIFEFIYFARPDSIVFNTPVQSVRRELGRQLAWEAPAPGDIVVPVPDSGNQAALGYAEVVRIPYEQGLTRNHYVGRTFIEPTQNIRDFGTRVKLNPIKSAIAGKRVVLVDDSIVRGTTLRKITKMIREAGATQIHVRISSPPHRSACYYGIDFPTKRELIAATHTREEVRRHLAVESLEYISLEGLLKSVRNAKSGFCLACFDGRYPVLGHEAPTKDALETVRPAPPGSAA